jgi:hypothetical protein
MGLGWIAERDYTWLGLVDLALSSKLGSLVLMIKEAGARLPVIY